MSPSLFNFSDAKDRFTSATRIALDSKTSKTLINAFNQTPGTETEKKTTLDQAFRSVLEEEIIQRKASCEDFLGLIYLSIDGVTEGICSATTPFLLLGDVLDCLPLDQCDKIFSFVEENVSTWKSNSFYSAGKNYLLRMCNDLLRRLSKSQNTVFCGRIQLFLARLFPLSEKSGLNLQSQFNLENITVFNKNEQESTLGQKHPEERDDGMEVEEGEMGDEEAPTTFIKKQASLKIQSGPEKSSIPIDYNLYRKFWTLQDYFRNPLQCYEKYSWLTFLKYSDETLSVFKSYKLDDMQVSKKKLEELKTTGGENVYFAKFLTSEKLMDLQLSDSNFRRHILLQYLILFQYMKGQVKFKSSSCVLTDEQSLWMEDTGTFIIRQLCLLLNAENIFHSMADILLKEEDLKFASIMVQTLNTILLTSAELFQLRNQLKDLHTQESCALFCCLYRSWCHNPVATVSLCFLTQNYKHAYDLIQKFGDLEVTVDFLMEVDKLVQLIECPIFTYLRLQLLDVENNPYLIKALYGLLMLLPQSQAFMMLSHRLRCVPNPELMRAAPQKKPADSSKPAPVHIDYGELLQHFDRVQNKHLEVRHQRAGRAEHPDRKLVL